VKLSELSELHEPSLLRTLVQQLLAKQELILFNVASNSRVAIFQPNGASSERKKKVLNNGVIYDISVHDTGLIYFTGMHGEWVRVMEYEVDRLLTLNQTEHGWELTNAPD
jgi:hypothetical protein